MNAHLVTNESMRADHRTWLAAHSQWRQDAARWQTEHELAVARLAELQSTVQEHGASLTSFLQSLSQMDEALAAHEKEMADAQEAGRNRSPEDVVANRHIEPARRFDQERDAYERIKRHHAAVMTQLRTLESALAAAM